jgi:uncharacterized protein
MDQLPSPDHPSVGEWADGLGLTCDILDDAGHISLDDGYGPWPAVLDWCLHATTPISAR